jgi:hypothetical protein
LIDYERLRKDLVINFEQQYNRGEVHWPTRFTDAAKSAMPNTPAVIAQRINVDAESYLFNKPSVFRIADAHGDFVRRIGDGSFSTLSYKSNDRICTFVGELITNDDYKLREDAGQGGYAVYVNQDYCLDCPVDNCLASYANSPRRAFDTVTQKKAEANCRIARSFKDGDVVICLRATKIIMARDEICYSYGKEYRYPI